MDNLIFCLNATVPIFAIIVLGRWLRSKNFFTKQTLTDIDRLSFKVAFRQNIRLSIGFSLHGCFLVAEEVLQFL